MLAFARKESAIPIFGIRVQSILDGSNIDNNNIRDTIIPGVPPGTFHHPKVITSVTPSFLEFLLGPSIIQKFV